MHYGNFSGYLPLEMEMGGFLIPPSNGGGDVVHSLDSLHNPNQDSGGEIGDKGGGVFDFIVLGMNDI